MAGNISNDCYSGTNNLVEIEPEKLAALIGKYEQWAKKNKVLLHEEVEKQMPINFRDLQNRKNCHFEQSEKSG